MSITRINRFEAKDGVADELQAFLASLIPFIEAASGCTACEVLQNHERTHEFLIVEVWDSIDAHRASLKHIPPEKMTMIKPMLAAPPSGSYYTSHA